MPKAAAPLDFIVRGWNITIMGRRTPSPRAVAVCRLTGEEFAATAEGHAADVLGVLAGFIDATRPDLWRRATGERGTLAVCEDHAGRWWTMRPPTIPQDGPRSVPGVKSRCESGPLSGHRGERGEGYSKATARAHPDRRG